MSSVLFNSFQVSSEEQNVNLFDAKLTGAFDNKHFYEFYAQCRICY